MNKTLLSFGHGYSAQALSRKLAPEGWRIIGTTRTPANFAAIRASGATPLLWPDENIVPPLEAATHMLISAGPDASGDPVLAKLRGSIQAVAPNLIWAGYLSTTGVYGDHNGDWVDEATPVTPSTDRGEWRALAEAEWASIPGLPLHIFRLAGIYGPGRGPFAKVRKGTARRIVKSGQVFSRIHVEDIAQVLAASIKRPNPGAIYNVCDDDPAPPQDVIAHAAQLLGLPSPPEISFHQADLSPMARSFYAENKRVRNERIKTELGVRLKYPTYREGLAALVTAA
ncbi:SDR family oxidoreductase [Pontibaca salina]|uniref:SDR family oxidoreductase n=1 Tax=Pontibaca salina TaxID=2795731 RepID=A0A934HU46_9RHOB|nr:SDR family oxidoreductase [Pontibaca salina]MBI6630570.1 SDR family oxidoreductase [Pontibaca salina]